VTNLTELDIRRAIAGNACAAGRAYWSNGRVREALVAPDGRSVEGRVQGSARRPYDQHIRLSGKPGAPPNIVGDCSCPVGFNCKHIAAVLYEVLARQPRQTADVVALRPVVPHHRHPRRARRNYRHNCSPGSATLPAPMPMTATTIRRQSASA